MPLLVRLSACALAILRLLSSAHANDIDDVNSFVESGQTSASSDESRTITSSQAARSAAALSQRRDSNRTGQTQDAIGTFTKLTEEYPELPEPYNNLAVLHASGGQFDKARAALKWRFAPTQATQPRTKI